MPETCIAPTQCSPAELARQLNNFSSGCLHVRGAGLEWFLYVQHGQLIYATNTVDPFERLERYLRALPQMSALSNIELRAQVRQFEQDANPQSSLRADYQALRWVADQGHCDFASLATLGSKIVVEVLESYLMLPAGAYQVQTLAMGELPEICQLPLEGLWSRLAARLDQWNAMAPRISSPYQRPYLIGAERARQVLAPAVAEKLSRLLLGFNFRQLGMLLQQDELALCRRFLPLIHEGTIVLRDPLPPHDRMPLLSRDRLKQPAKADSSSSLLSATGLAVSDSGFFGVASQPSGKRVWKIVCIDDSPAVLQEMQRFLQQDIFKITIIDDSQKALMKIISLKPDLILLDAGMPGLDGYQVCTMVRKSSALRHIPVVMVTGNTGLIDRARAKLAGTTDYLTKPFTQKDLLQIVLRYLSD